MAETQSSTPSLSQQDLSQKDKDLLQEFGKWLSDGTTQFQDAVAGVQLCADSDLQKKASELFKSLSCFTTVSICF